MAKDKSITGLNPRQKSAIEHGRGPLLIIAGAGTGKTTVITRRIAYLISQKLAEPEEIIALTFTDKAASEMEERVDILVPYGYTNTRISTFHAFGDHVLRQHALAIGLTPDFQVLSRAQQVVFFREHLFEFPVKYYRPLGDPTRYLEAMITLFSRAKDEDISPERYLQHIAKLERKAKKRPHDRALKEEVLREKEIALCYKKYQELLMREGKVDFGNQVYLALELFRRHPAILRRYQKQFKYILVDEFQDTNFSQFQLVKLLAKGTENITVVADDDQSVFKFRGAAISNILNFISYYPRARKVVLTRNYRSHQKILDDAYRLIRYNDPDRLEVTSNIEKRLRGTSKKGPAPRHLYFDTVSTEADEVARIIAEKIKSGKYKLGDFAILVRSNNDADPFLRALNMRSLPWRFTGNQGLYRREEVRLIIAFLRSLVRPQDSLSLYHLAVSEIYCLNMLDLTHLMNYAARRNLSLYSVFQRLEEIEELSHISTESVATVRKLLGDLSKYSTFSRTHPTGELIYRFLKETGYLRRLTKAASASDEKVQNIAKFFEIVRSTGEILNEDRAPRFVAHIDLLIQAGDNPAVVEANLDIPAINVLTIHKAKGLEFRVVFMVSLVMGRFPWPRRREAIPLPEELIKEILPTGDFHIEEERRLFYVGMTRAKEELYLSSARDYGGMRARKISQFVLEALDLPKKPLTAKNAEATEVIKRSSSRPPSSKRVRGEAGEIGEKEILNLSYFHLDDYLTCPLKYKYVHILRVPVLRHHTVIYGKALHDAVQRYNEAKLSGRKISPKELIETFEASWASEGFLTREHEKERLRAGKAALRKFWRCQEKSKTRPASVEKEFSFLLDYDRIRGRWDRIDQKAGRSTIIDFKSSEIRRQEDADRRTRKSLQLAIYALAHKMTFGKIPEQVQLYFLESGLVGTDEKKEKDLEKVIKKIKEASSGIRKRKFPARPAYLACRFCAYQEICPYTAAR